MRIQISVLTERMPSKETSRAHKKPSIEERVRDACEMVESGHDSRQDWALLRKINNHLMALARKKPLSERQASVLKLIQPIIQKYSTLDDNYIEQDTEVLSSLK